MESDATPSPRITDTLLTIAHPASSSHRERLHHSRFQVPLSTCFEDCQPSSKRIKRPKRMESRTQTILPRKMAAWLPSTTPRRRTGPPRTQSMEIKALPDFVDSKAMMEAPCHHLNTRPAVKMLRACSPNMLSCFMLHADLFPLRQGMGLTTSTPRQQASGTI